MSIRRQKQSFDAKRAPSISRRLALLSATSLCLAMLVASPAKADECQPTGQDNCPTESCFFWVSGVFPGTTPYPSPTSYDRIGNSTRWSVGDQTGGSDLVGPGEYPDSYANGTGPFAHATVGSFDGIALGANTRLQIFSQPNFGGSVLLDITGPRVLNNCPQYGSAYNCTSFLTENWSSQGSLFAQFPPATRSNSAVNMWTYGGSGGGGFPQQCSDTGFGMFCMPNPDFVPTSIKVTCSSPPTGTCLPGPTTCTPTNGACATYGGAYSSQPAGDTATGCTSGDYIDDTDSGSQFRWRCTGLNGGSSADCAANIGGSPPPVVNGACAPFGSTYSTQPATNTPSGCTAGSYADAPDTPTQFQWTCNGANGGSSPTCSATIYSAPPSPPCEWQAQGPQSCGYQVAALEADTHCESFGGFAGIGSNCASAGTGVTCNHGGWAGGGSPYGTCGGSQVYQRTLRCTGVCPPPPSPPIVNGACFTWSGQYSAQPAYGTPNGCTSGTYVDTGDDASNFNWSCTGINGGSTVNCTAAIASPPGTCSEDVDPTNYCLVGATTFAAEGCVVSGCSQAAVKVRDRATQTTTEYWQSTSGEICTGTCGGAIIKGVTNTAISSLEACNPSPPCP